MKTKLITLVIILFIAINVSAQTIWNGPVIAFTKDNFAPWNSEANQDRITNNVWITRADTQGIFNINQESFYSSISPKDTEWAFGTTSDLESLTFTTWSTAMGGSPPTKVDLDMVVHLITDDIYADIKFTSWTMGAGAGSSNGGGFAYERSSDSGLNVNDLKYAYNFKISPNPAKHFIQVKFLETISTVQIDIYNVLGKQMYSKLYTSNTPINISYLNAGLYFLKVSSDGIVKTKKIIKY